MLDEMTRNIAENPIIHAIFWYRVSIKSM